MKRRSFLQFTGLSAVGAYLSTQADAFKREHQPVFSNEHGWTTAKEVRKPYRITSSDDIVRCTNTQPITLTLPARHDSQRLYIIASGQGTVTVDRHVLKPKEALMAVHDSKQWVLIGGHPLTHAPKDERE